MASENRDSQASDRQKMMAVRIHAPGPPAALRIESIPVPEPGPGEVRVAVAYCGLNPLDVFARAGRANVLVKGWPLIPGLEHSGVVEAVGPGVSPTWLGRRVISRTSFGGNAEFAVDPVSDLVRVPDGIDLSTAAVYRGASHTAWRVLHESARAHVGQSLLVHSAAGPVGIMLTQLALQIGMRVIGLVGDEAKARYATRFGASRLIVAQERTAWVSAVLEATACRGVDLTAVADLHQRFEERRIMGRAVIRVGGER